MSEFVLNPNFTLSPQTTGFMGTANPLNTGVVNPVNSLDGGGFLDGVGGFLQSDGFKMGLQGAQSLASMWNAFNANKLARQQLRFTRNFANANLANQTKSYNTALSDRARSRGFVEGQTQDQIDGYVAANRLADRKV